MTNMFFFSDLREDAERSNEEIKKMPYSSHIGELFKSCLCFVFYLKQLISMFVVMFITNWKMPEVMLAAGEGVVIKLVGQVQRDSAEEVYYR